MVLCLSKGFPNWIRILLLNKHASRNWIQFQCLFFFLIWYNGFLYEKHTPLLEMSNGVICTNSLTKTTRKAGQNIFKSLYFRTNKTMQISMIHWGQRLSWWASLSLRLFVISEGHLKVRLSSTLDSLHTLGEQRFGAQALTKENRPDEHPSLKGATCESKT